MAFTQVKSTNIANGAITAEKIDGNTSFTFSNTITTRSILPAANDTYDLGSANMVWRDVYIGPGSLYINGKEVLTDTNNTITVSTSNNQDLAIHTSGSGDIDLHPQGTGVIAVRGPLQIEAGENITSSDGNGIGITGPLLVDTVRSKTADTDLTLSANGTGVVRVTDDLVITGNIVFSGNVFTVNAEVVTINDNIIDLNSNFTTGNPTENAGIRVIRGDETAVLIRWNETSNQWEFTNDGATYTAIGGAGAKGDKGDTGATGAKGDKGDIGATGATGAKGEKGDKGDLGDKGEIGTTGTTGAKGEKGDSGGVDLSGTTNTAILFNDSGFANGSAAFAFNKTSNTITVGGNIIPNANITYDIGSSTMRFKDLYLSGTTIDLAGATISSNGTALTLPQIVIQQVGQNPVVLSVANGSLQTTSNGQVTSVSKPRFITVSQTGTLTAPVTSDARYYPPFDITINKVYAHVGTTPSGNFAFALKKNGTTVGTYTISSGQNRLTPTVASIAANTTDYLSLTITSGTSSDLTVELEYTAT